MLQKFSKKDCVACHAAVRFCQLHHIPVKERDIVIESKHQILIMYPALDEEELLGVSSFPIFVDEDQMRVYDYHALQTYWGESLLLENSNRHVLFPIQDDELWTMYEKAVASFWTTQEIDFTGDEQDFHRLTPNEQHFIKNVLAFFASADGIVNENLAVHFSNEVQLPEARAFYSYQQFNETIHSHTYSLMIDNLVKSTVEKDTLLRGVDTIPCVGLKASWASKWITNNACFAKRLVAFICVEGIMFSGSFCAIFWLKQRGLMHGLAFSNELIARDEGMHQQFGTLLYRRLQNKLTVDEILEIVTEAVQHEQQFIMHSIPCKLIGMNEHLMSQYIEFVADRILVDLGYQQHYMSTNPFDFMEHISLAGKTNFFERRVGEYAKAGFLVQSKDQGFGLDCPF